MSNWLTDWFTGYARYSQNIHHRFIIDEYQLFRVTGGRCYERRTEKEKQQLKIEVEQAKEQLENVVKGKVRHIRTSDVTIR